MIKLAVQSTDAPQAVEWIRSAIDAKIAQIKHAIVITERRLAEFESKYQADSQTFLETMTAEDLEGGDLEYVEWYGECELLKRLQLQLDQLMSIEYEHPC